VDVNSPVVIMACLAGAAAVTAALFVRRAPHDALPYLCAYFVFFGFGPVLNVLLGNTVYFGTRLDRVGFASVGLVLALLGMLVVWLVAPVHAAVGADRGGPRRRYPLVAPILFALAAYALWVLQQHGTALLAGDKLDRTALAGPWHYQFLLAEMIACSLYAIAVRTSPGRIAFWTNMVCYAVYCLATAERDFLFVLFVLLLHSRVSGRRGPAVAALAAGGTLVVAAAYLAQLRGGATLGPSAILNQGTILFVDTYVMDMVPRAVPYQYGETYLSAVLSLLPQNLGSDPYTLSDWLVATYAPGVSTGYGFSLTAEAYLNFGLLGIPVVFAALTAVQRFLVNRLDRGPFYPYASVLFTVCWMYGFRGESVVMLRTLVYGAILYAAVHLTSLRQRDGADHPRGSRPRPPARLARRP
jgi:hypothetical protein